VTGRKPTKPARRTATKPTKPARRKAITKRAPAAARRVWPPDLNPIAGPVARPGEGRARHRCGWANPKTPIYLAYHDEEWGVPVHDDRRLFEFLVLEGAQAGLSWETILRKRDAYRRAFAGFDPHRVARFDARRRASLLADSGIVRNRLKIESAIRNARAFLAVQEEFGSFDAYSWRFVSGAPRQNAWRSLREIPARMRESDAFSKDMRSRGFTFVGSTILYAHMQACGMVNDHLVGCFRHAECAALAARG
jgi:DNA-3-methyladenine glycosylase I